MAGCIPTTKAMLTSTGCFISLNREINIIKRSGEKIASTEVESILETYPDIAEAAVIGVPDAIRDEAVKSLYHPPGRRVVKQRGDPGVLRNKNGQIQDSHSD